MGCSGLHDLTSDLPSDFFIFFCASVIRKTQWTKSQGLLAHPFVHVSPKAELSTGVIWPYYCGETGFKIPSECFAYSEQHPCVLADVALLAWEVEGDHLCP